MVLVGLAALLALLVVAFLAGIAGAFFGIGGGIVIVPFLTLVLDKSQQVATAVSIVGVIATSSAAASVYVRDHMTNLRLGMFLELATTMGAIFGALLAITVLAKSGALAFLFAVAVLYAAYTMLRRREADVPAGPVRPTGLAARLRLADAYRERDGRSHPYAVERPGSGLAVGAVAGATSGMLGLGGGFIQVPVMNLVMKAPIRAAVATSNFMIGVTAAASAFVYYFSGYLDLTLAGIVVVGVASGTLLGTRLMRRTPPLRIRAAFGVLMVVIGILMGLKAFGVIGVI